MKKFGLTLSVFLMSTAFANTKDIVILTDLKTGEKQVYTGVSLKEIKEEDFKDARQREAILKSVKESVKTGELVKEFKVQKQTEAELKEAFKKVPQSADEELANVIDQAKSAVVLVQPEVKKQASPQPTATPTNADEELATKGPTSSYFVYGYGYVNYGYNPYVYGYGGFYNGFAVGVYRPFYYNSFFNYNPYFYRPYHVGGFYPRYYNPYFRRW